MKLTEGRAYRARNGEKVIVMRREINSVIYFPFYAHTSGCIRCWHENGRAAYGKTAWDLVEELYPVAEEFPELRRYGEEAEAALKSAIDADERAKSADSAYCEHQGRIRAALGIKPESRRKSRFSASKWWRELDEELRIAVIIAACIVMPVVLFIALNC